MAGRAGRSSSPCRDSPIDRTSSAGARLQHSVPACGRLEVSDVLFLEVDMSLETLIDSLKNGTGIKRSRAAAELGQLGDVAAGPALVDALSDTNPTVRSNAAFALAELGLKEAAPHLVRLLADSDEWVRKSAAKGLGLLRAEEAVPHLEKLLEDDSDMVRRNARRSLKQIQGQ
ncbi:MAG: HEAT repeat domain-containing protein [Deltaproteobacteria bacterium]|nr:MAG: HEAT repeat domain-containing protein [Deltaproteobacteria bacterium]